MPNRFIEKREVWKLTESNLVLGNKRDGKV